MESVVVFDEITFTKGASELDAYTVIYVRLGVRPRLLRFLAISCWSWTVVWILIYSYVCA
jgi:hypothetical protein